MRSFFLYLYLVNKFPKSEKLKSSKAIAALFSDGKSHFKYPLKVIFLKNPSLEKNLAAFAVPKRNFKLAVDRNRIKRQIREAYRLNKGLLSEREKEKYEMLFLFLSKEKPTYEELSKSMGNLLKKMTEEK